MTVTGRIKHIEIDGVKYPTSGLMHQAFGRATRPEPRTKRDRRNRGPEQQGKWWQRS